MKRSFVNRVTASALLVGLVSFGVPTAAVHAYADDSGSQEEATVSTTQADSLETASDTDEQTPEASQEETPVSPPSAGSSEGSSPTTDEKASIPATKVGPVKRAAAPKRTNGSGDEVATQLALSGPESGDVAYVGDVVVFQVTLTDASGQGVQGKRVKVTAFIPGVSNSTSVIYGLTNASGVAEIAFDGLDEGRYSVYAEFEGDASSWGGTIYSAAPESATFTLTVKPASEKPIGPSSGSGAGSEQSQKATTVSISIERELPTSDWFYVRVTVTDASGKPVVEDRSNNVELYVDGEQKGAKKLESDESWGTVGAATFEQKFQSREEEYEVYVKYVGTGDYASSESSHFILNVLPDSFTASEKPAEQQPGDDPQPGDEPSGEGQSGSQQPGDEKPGDDPQSGEGQPSDEQPGDQQSGDESQAGDSGQSDDEASAADPSESDDSADDTPETGDDAAMLLTASLVACGATVAGVGVLRKRRQAR